MKFNYDIYTKRKYKMPRDQDLIWITKTGERIPIKDLTDSHLFNIVSYLEKHAEASKAFELNYLNDMSMFIVGEAAEFDIDQRIRNLESMNDIEYLLYAVPQYEYLIEEMTKRKLCMVCGTSFKQSECVCNISVKFKEDK